MEDEDIEKETAENSQEEDVVAIDELENGENVQSESQISQESVSTPKKKMFASPKKTVPKRKCTEDFRIQEYFKIL